MPPPRVIVAGAAGYMLEHPSISHYSMVADLIGIISDNVTSADNQQERLRFAAWLSGFVDGEGCFAVPVQHNAQLRFGYQVQPQFVVVQGAHSAAVLELIRDHLGCGRINENVRRDNHRGSMYRYIVRRLDDLADIIVPFFREHPLRTAKRHDFEQFARVVALMRVGHHLDPVGFDEVVRIAESTNFRKPRRGAQNPQRLHASHLG